jgi:NitT/TauT family transport system substrate-binding protein
MAVYPGSLISLPEYVGAERGIYKSNGIDAKIVPVPTGPEQIAAAASGSVDIISMTVSLGLLATNQGQDLVILTNNISEALFTWLAQKDFPTPHLADPYPAPIKDFKGARIGVAARGAETELFTQLLLADAGLDPKRDVVFVPVAFGQTALAAFEAKQVDIIVTIEPAQTLLVNRGIAKTVLDLRSGKEGPEVFHHFPGNSRMAVRSLATSKSDDMKRYVKAQREILQFIADPKNTEEVSKVFAKASGQAPEVARSIVEKSRSIFTIEFSCKGYKNVVTYLQRVGQMTADQVAKAPACESFIAPAAKDILQQ